MLPGIHISEWQHEGVIQLSEWKFDAYVINLQANISSRLDNVKEVLEETLSGNCRLLNIKSTVMFTYSMFAFKVNAQFTAVYRNFTNRQSFDICILYNTETFPNLRIIKTLFDDVYCGTLISSKIISNKLVVEDILEYCDDTMGIHNVTTVPGKFELYCDVRDKMITFETPILEKSNSSVAAVNDDMVTSDFSNMHHISTGMFSKETSSSKSEWKISIYILAPAAAVFLILCVAIFLVRLRKRAQAQKREKSYETIINGGQTQYINMPDNTHNYDVIGYRRERRQESRS
nr:uncharacterized protein LOC117691278 isoform X3 [Crassostrea gigas]XP_034332889.1 uncharacterized protein LOC117691278 isoform X3 [Crassostrea gigas]